MQRNRMNAQLSEYINTCINDFDTIPNNRIELLNNFIDIAETMPSNEILLLNFICTHNSRRSQFAQVWAHIAAEFYGIKVKSYSGGTEATAFNINAVNALKRAGVQIQVLKDSANPVYKVYDNGLKDLLCFSKTYDDSSNPRENFIAVMTCSDADENCPFVFGATKRIKLLYDDPKISDGTSQETTIYDERCKQIATELLYVTSKLK